MSCISPSRSSGCFRRSRLRGAAPHSHHRCCPPAAGSRRAPGPPSGRSSAAARGETSPTGGARSCTPVSRGSRLWNDAVSGLLISRLASKQLSKKKSQYPEDPHPWPRWAPVPSSGTSAPGPLPWPPFPGCHPPRGEGLPAPRLPRRRLLRPRPPCEPQSPQGRRRGPPGVAWTTTAPAGGNKQMLSWMTSKTEYIQTAEYPMHQCKLPVPGSSHYTAGSRLRCCWRCERRVRGRCRAGGRGRGRRRHCTRPRHHSCRSTHGPGPPPLRQAGEGVGG